MNRAILLHRLKPMTDEVFSFDRFPDALRRMEAASHFGKIVISVGN